MGFSRRKSRRTPWRSCRSSEDSDLGVYRRSEYLCLGVSDFERSRCSGALDFDRNEFINAPPIIFCTGFFTNCGSFRVSDSRTEMVSPLLPCGRSWKEASTKSRNRNGCKQHFMEQRVHVCMQQVAQVLAEMSRLFFRSTSRNRSSMCQCWRMAPHEQMQQRTAVLLVERIPKLIVKQSVGLPMPEIFQESGEAERLIPPSRSCRMKSAVMRLSAREFDCCTHENDS